MKCMQIRFRVVYVQRASICDRWRFRFNVDIFHSNPSKIHMFSSFVSPFFCRFSSIHRNQIMWHLCFSACDTIINRKKGRSSYAARKFMGFDLGRKISQVIKRSSVSNSLSLLECVAQAHSTWNVMVWREKNNIKNWDRNQNPIFIEIVQKWRKP